MEPNDERAEVQHIGAEEFLALLVSRRSLERLQIFPRRARGRPRGLRDRATGAVYVWTEGSPDAPAASPPAAVGGAAG